MKAFLVKMEEHVGQYTKTIHTSVIAAKGEMENIARREVIT